jgi:3-deoxy-manno-octulosonate cytidylyltransferase (CMP-KDO synthetase)
MIERVVLSAVNSKLTDAVIVATEDERVFSFVKEKFAGIKQKTVSVLMTSEKHNSGTDRVHEVVQKIPEAENIINLQGDEPLMPAEYIDKVFNLLIDECKKDPGIKKKLITSLITRDIKTEDINNPNIVKAVIDNNGFALYFSRSRIPYCVDESQAKKTTYYRHLGIYGYTRDSILSFSLLPSSMLENAERLEQLRALENEMKIKLGIVSKAYPSVDRVEDIKRVEELIYARNKV